MYADFEGLRKPEFRAVFREIETHTGIVLQAGSGYIFSHKTFQEYLFAQYLIDFPEIPRSSQFLSWYPNELALAVSFNENPSLYFAYLVLNRTDTISEHDTDFLIPFLDRLILEETRFRVHPYLGLAFLALYTEIIRLRGRRSSFDRTIKAFYSFLNNESRLTQSVQLLAPFYRISCRDNRHGYFTLERYLPYGRSHIEETLRYEEPINILAPYDLFEVFAGVRGA